MAVKVAINGFGRIGRLAFRQMFGHEGSEIVAINDLTSPDMLAYLLKYDSTQGNYARDHEVVAGEDSITVDGKEIKIYKEADANNLPWGDLDVDVVLECTGFYTSKAKAQAHINAGAKKVLISAPAKDDTTPTVVFGVNHDILKASDVIVSAGSCTTNSMAAMVKLLDENWGIKAGFMTTIHAYTGTQMLLDGPRGTKTGRNLRAAAINTIAHSTGAAKAIGLVIPELNGKLTGMSMRVPTLDVSVVDLTVNLAKPAKYEEICAAMKAASEGELKGILGYTDEAVVSSDFLGDTRTSIFDADAGIALTDTFVKVVSWYDNENSYTSQMVRTIKYFEKFVA